MLIIKWWQRALSVCLRESDRILPFYLFFSSPAHIPRLFHSSNLYRTHELDLSHILKPSLTHTRSFDYECLSST